MARSPNYPAVSLGEAITLVDRIFARERQSSMTHEVAASAMGYSALHGPARRKIAALRKFGLLDAVGGNLRVSSSALAILHPSDETERVAALREAALRPELYRELASESGASDANLASMLIRRGFLPDGARKAVASFRETMSLVADAPDDESRSHSEPPQLVTDPVDVNVNYGSGERASATMVEFIWPLPRGVRVHLRITGGPLTREGLDMLRRYLDVMEGAIQEPRNGDTADVLVDLEPTI